MQVSRSEVAGRSPTPGATPDRCHLDPGTAIFLVSATLTADGATALVHAPDGKQLYEVSCWVNATSRWIGPAGATAGSSSDAASGPVAFGGGRAFASFRPRQQDDTFEWGGNPNIPWHQLARSISRWLLADRGLCAEVVAQIPEERVTAEAIIDLSESSEWVLVELDGSLLWRNNHANYTEFAVGDVLHDGAVVVASHHGLRAATSDNQWVMTGGDNYRLRLHHGEAHQIATALNARKGSRA